MRLVEVPFIWTVLGIRPRARTPSFVGVLDHAPASLRSVDEPDDAPLVARLDRRGSLVGWSPHVPVEAHGHCNPETIEYREMDGALWRPVWGKMPGVPQHAVTDLSFFEACWKESIKERGKAVFCDRDAFCTVSDQRSLPRRGVHREVVDVNEMNMREVISTDYDTRRAEVVAAAERSFAMIGGKLFCRTPGPGFLVHIHHEHDGNATYYFRQAISVVADGIAPSPHSDVFRADNVAEAEAWARTCLKTTGGNSIYGTAYRHALEVIDGEALSRLAFDEEQQLLLCAARKLLFDDEIRAVVDRASGHAMRALIDLQERMASAPFRMDVGERGYMEDAIRAIHGIFPVTQYDHAFSCFREYPSPVGALLHSLDWRRAYAANAVDPGIPESPNFR